MVFDDLSITIGARTSDAERSIESTDEKLDDLSGQALRTGGAFKLLESSVDGAGRSISSLGRRSTLAIGGVSGLTLSLIGLESAGAAAGTTLSVALLPAVTALSTVAAPLVGILGGLGAVLGAFGAVGVAGTLAATTQFTQLLKTELQETVTVFADLLAPAAEEFAALFLDLLNRLQGVAAEIVPTRRVFNALADTLFVVGNEIINILPEVSALASELILRFAPAIQQVARGAIRELPSIIRTLVGVFERFLPQLVNFATAVAGAVPDILRFGSAILTQLLPALTTAARGFGDVLGGVLDFIQSVDSVGEAFSRIISAIPVNRILARLSALAGQAIRTLRTELLTSGNVNALASTFQTLADQGLQALTSFLSSGQAGARFDAAFGVLSQAVTAFGDLAADGLQAIEAAVTSQEGRAAIAGIGEILGETLVRAADLSGQLLGELLSVIVNNRDAIVSIGTLLATALAEGIVKGIGGALVDAIQPALRAALLEVAAGQARLLGAGDLAAQASGRAAQLRAEASRQQQFEQRARELSAELQQQGQSQTGQRDIRVVVEGDTDVVRDVAVEELQREDLRTRERGGFTGAPGT